MAHGVFRWVAGFTGLLLGLGGHVWAADWEVLKGCTLIHGSFNDGDSFHTAYRGKTYVFRLYFVDAPEAEDQFSDRVKAQARYFRISSEEALKVGEFAASFTEKALARPFTVITCWQDAKGQTKLGRSFAFVIPSGAKIKDLGKTDLAGLLIGNGLVRLYGAPGSPDVPDSPQGGKIEGRLAVLEQHARADKLGGYSPDLKTEIKTGSMEGVDFAMAEAAPVAMETPAKEQGANLEPNIPINMGNLEIKESKNKDGYSNIPGWKPGKKQVSAETEEPKTMIDINTASEKELQSMPVISAEIADAIVKGRPYESVNDLLHVSGITQNMLELMEPELICGRGAKERVEAEPPEDGRP